MPRWLPSLLLRGLVLLAAQFRSDSDGRGRLIDCAGIEPEQDLR